MATATASKPSVSKSSAGASLPASALKAALRAVDPAVAGRTAKPILQNVLLADGHLTATDGELRITVSVEYDGPPTLLPYGRIKAIVDSVATEAVVALAVLETSVTVKAAGGRWTLPVEDHTEYPPEAPAKLKPVARIPADQFVRAVASSVIGVDKATARAVFGGVLIDVRDGEANFVGTDGRRLCIVECGIDQAVDDTATVCPEATIKAAMKLAVSGAVQIEASTAEIVFSSDSWRVAGRIIAGAFPKWRDVLPDRETTDTVVDRGELLAAVQAASVCASETSRGVVFEFGAGLRLSSRSSANGEAKVLCPVIEDGDATKVMLDPAYVIEWLESLPGKDADPNVTIDALDRASAVVFRCDDATAVVMPLDPGD